MERLKSFCTLSKYIFPWKINHFFQTKVISLANYIFSLNAFYRQTKRGSLRKLIRIYNWPEREKKWDTQRQLYLFIVFQVHKYMCVYKTLNVLSYITQYMYRKSKHVPGPGVASNINALNPLAVGKKMIKFWATSLLINHVYLRMWRNVDLAFRAPVYHLISYIIERRIPLTGDRTNKDSAHSPLHSRCLCMALKQ